MAIISVKIYPSYMYALFGSDPGAYLADGKEKQEPLYKDEFIMTSNPLVTKPEKLSSSVANT